MLTEMKRGNKKLRPLFVLLVPCFDVADILRGFNFIWFVNNRWIYLELGVNSSIVPADSGAQYVSKAFQNVICLRKQTDI
jgi:hypothetical protein